MASAKEIKEAVRKRYTAVAESSSCGCGGGCGCGSEAEGGSCCGGGVDPRQAAATIGYNVKELEEIPQEAILGLGCGSPVAYVGLKAGETVLDLGSGGGIDVFLAAKKVGSKGKVLGVDMNEAMIKRAKEAAEEYAKELAINPDYDDVHYNFGLLRYREGRFEEAKDLWKRTLEINPDYGEARSALEAAQNGDGSI